MLSEAINQETGPATAFDYLSHVRVRAGLAPLFGLDKAAFRTRLLQERMGGTDL